MDEQPDRQVATGFEGFDSAMDPTKLPAGICADGLNVWCNGDGYVQSRPGARLNCDTGDFNYGNLVYFDQPGTEYTIALHASAVRTIASTGNNVSSTSINATGTTAYGSPVQFLDKVFWLRAGVLTYITPTTGIAATVTQFSDGTAMPSWSRIVVQGFRVLLFSDDGEKLYASAVGQAHTNADWVKTENIRVGDGDGDPARALIAGQAGFVVMLCGRSCWQIDMSAASVANWTSYRVTKLAGCAAGRTAMAIGQDVYFLSRYGVVSLGALAATDSISPSATLSAPLQSYFDRINWSEISKAWATKWRDLYLLALPLDSDLYPVKIFPFNLRTRRWQAPWTLSTQISGACVTGFGDKEETLLQAYTGQVLRIDDAVAYDEVTAGAQTTFSSWAVLRHMDHGAPQQYKHPFFVEAVFSGHTGVDTMLGLLPEGTAGQTSALGLSAYQVGSTFTGAGGVQTKRFLARSKGRYREAALQVWATSGKLKLREAALSAFVEAPFYS